MWFYWKSLKSVSVLRPVLWAGIVPTSVNARKHIKSGHNCRERSWCTALFLKAPSSAHWSSLCTPRIYPPSSGRTRSTPPLRRWHETIWRHTGHLCYHIDQKHGELYRISTCVVLIEASPAESDEDRGHLVRDTCHPWTPSSYRSQSPRRYNHDRTSQICPWPRGPARQRAHYASTYQQNH